MIDSTPVIAPTPTVTAAPTPVVAEPLSRRIVSVPEPALITSVAVRFVVPAKTNVSSPVPPNNESVPSVVLKVTPLVKLLASMELSVAAVAVTLLIPEACALVPITIVAVAAAFSV